MDSALIERVRAYLRGIEQGDLEAVLGCYTPDAVQVEWPNKIKPDGGERGLAQIAADFEKGRALLARQSYEVVHHVEMGSAVVVELIWRGTLAIPLGRLAAGDEMVAYSAVCVDFEGDKIRAQRNYDCFKPF